MSTKAQLQAHFAPVAVESRRMLGMLSNVRNALDQGDGRAALKDLAQLTLMLLDFEIAVLAAIRDEPA